MPPGLLPGPGGSYEVLVAPGGSYDAPGAPGGSYEVLGTPTRSWGLLRGPGGSCGLLGLLRGPGGSYEVLADSQTWQTPRPGRLPPICRIDHFSCRCMVLFNLSIFHSLACTLAGLDPKYRQNPSTFYLTRANHTEINKLVVVQF